MMKYSVLLFSMLVFVLWSTPVLTNAASLYLDPGKATLNKGDSIDVSVRLDTDEAAGECVNSVDAVISYPDNIVPVDASTGDSIFSIWVETPTINKENRTITFAGGIPNGYCGRITGDPRLTNKIAKIIFRSPGFTVGGGSNSDNNEAKIDFIKGQTFAYLNDGQGTRAQTSLYGTIITMSDSVGSTQLNTWQDDINADDIPPAKFSIIGPEKSETAFSGKWFITFNSNDKQTGIDRYEVIEEPYTELGDFNWGAAGAPWVVTRSPYVLQDQNLNSIIRVKAVDKAGNETISTVIPEGAKRMLPSAKNVASTVVVFGLIALLIGLVVVVILPRIRERIKQKEAALEDLKDGNEYDEFQ